MTTDELMTEWIDKTARGRVKPRTLSRYRGLIDHHIHPVLGAREIGEVGRRQIADFLLDAARGPGGHTRPFGVQREPAAERPARRVRLRLRYGAAHAQPL